MNLSELLTELSQRGIQISADAEHLDIRAPKGSLTPGLRDQLVHHKSQILELYRNRAGARKSLELPKIVPDPQNRYEPFPLTDIQQAYWIGRSGSFALGDISIHIYSEIDAPHVDLPRLTAAWQKVVRRHDMLRAIVLSNGEQQILAEVPDYEIRTTDLRGKSAEEVDQALASLRDRLSHQVFATDVWPSFELHATLLDGGRTRIHTSIDLLNIDGGSLLILNQDWMKAYASPDEPLPPLELSYRDYVLAERALHETEIYKHSLEYWKKRVAELPPAPELPLARTPASIEKTRFVRRTTHVSAELWGAVISHAKAEGLTPSAVLLSVFAEVLRAFGKSPRFTVNVTLFNRLPLHPNVNELLGDFTSMILCGIDGAAGSFVERTRDVQERLWTDLEYRHVSGVEVLRELARVQKGTSGGAMPVVFTSMLSLGSQGYTPPATTWKPLGEPVFALSQTPQVWLDCQVFEEEGVLHCHWDAVEDLFPAGLLDGMFAAYVDALERLAREPALWTRALPQLSGPPEEQLAQRAAVNATGAPVPQQSLAAMFEARALARPEAIALVTSHERLTYGELRARSAHLGQALADARVRADGCVAIVMEKGWEQVVAVLGIHRAGAAYLPIDPEVPPERLRYLLAQGEVTIALTQPHLDRALAWPEGVRRIVVDDAPPPAGDVPVPAVWPNPEHLAYVLYTSGSTGDPKGVMIEHRNVVNRITDINARFAVGPDDRAMALSALHHDLSVYDLFGILGAGGTLVIPDAALVKEPSHWADLAARERVTFWNSVPAFLEMLVEHLESEPEAPRPSSMRLTILAGDWIPVTLPDRLRALVPGVTFVASGGPTETTVWDIVNVVGAVDPSWPSIPYGKPLTNSRYHVLNSALEPCPTWVPGELYIAGAGLGRGYYRDAERTAAKFITHPRTGERLYRSGDMGRWLPDGNIEFLGRDDFQLKIQGHRIELGEIEAALSQHPGVRSAVVIATGTRHRLQLVAHVVPADAGGGGGEGGGASTAQDLYAGSQQGVLTDPLERLEFKLRHAGIRKFAPAQASIELGAPGDSRSDTATYALRRSHRHFLTAPIGREKLARLLGVLSAIDHGGLAKYRYPSAGGLYPVQTYVYVKPDRIEGLSGGIYYHDPEAHRLHQVSAETDFPGEAHAVPNRGIFEASAFGIFFIGHMEAIAPMYGELARDFCMLEAGYMGQQLMLEAPSHGLGLCPLGLVDFSMIRSRFDLGEGDVLCHALLGGGVDPARARELPPPDAAASGSAPSMVDDLKEFLRQKLPKHMIPTIVLRESLPLTGNGKVDRKALAEAQVVRAPQKHVAPQNETERLLAKIVGDVLGTTDVSIHENFFDIGANSVHVVQICSKLRQEMGVDVKVTEAFRFPTIERLAQRLSEPAARDESVDRGRTRAEARLASRGRRGR